MNKFCTMTTSHVYNVSLLLPCQTFNWIYIQAQT